MFVGFICAMKEEATSLIKSLEGVKKEEHRGYSFHLGKRGKNTLVVTTSGVGKVNMAVCTTILLDRYHVDYVINYGVAGSINTKIGETVVSDAVRYYDFYIPEQVQSTKRPVYQVPYQPYPYKPSVDILNAAKNILKDEVEFGTIISGDQFVINKSQLGDCPKDGVVAVDMESAAAAQVCYLFSTDFIIIRSISDNLSGEEFTGNLSHSIERGYKLALKFVDNYSK